MDLAPLARSDRGVVKGRHPEIVARRNVYSSDYHRKLAPVSKFIIYGLTEPDGNIRYVGLSRCGLLRVKQHGYPSAVARQRPCACWIRSLRARGLDYGWTVLERCLDATRLPDAEQRWIRQLREAGADLLNCTDGGEGSPGMNAETRAKLRAAHLGRKRPPRSPEWCERIAAAQRGKKRTPEQIERQAAALRGRTLTEERKQALRIGHARRRAERDASGQPYFTNEHRAKIAAAAREQWARQARHVFDETTGIEYPSQAAAAKAIGVSAIMIGHVVHGRAPAARGHRLRFV